uniref:Uncharacterized protein n=1 Tax=Oryza nivara TaxID=4536 RepID=A0A0E0J0E3_ORYNI
MWKKNVCVDFNIDMAAKIIHVSQLEEKSIHALQLGLHGEDLLIHTLEAVVALPLYQGRELSENRAE